jgi:hypothetical protein
LPFLVCIFYTLHKSSFTTFRITPTFYAIELSAPYEIQSGFGAEVAPLAAGPRTEWGSARPKTKRRSFLRAETPRAEGGAAK